MLKLFSLAIGIFGIIYFLKYKKLSTELSDLERYISEMEVEGHKYRIIFNDEQRTKNLRKSLNELNRRLHEENVRLSKKEIAFNQLICNLTHDIKTPLTSLIGYLEIINYDLDNENTKENLEKSYYKAKEIKTSINNLFELFLSNSGDRQIYLEDSDINELLRQGIAKWIDQFIMNDISLEINIGEEPFNTKVDEFIFESIIDNLFKNVIDHSSATKLSISTYEDLYSFDIKISDNGIGMREVDLEQIFMRSYISDLSKSNRGSGLGLAIVKDGVEKMGGTIEIESTENKETNILIRYPKTSIT